MFLPRFPPVEKVLQSVSGQGQQCQAGLLKHGTIVICVNAGDVRALYDH